jgi:hypothetical protein
MMKQMEQKLLSGGKALQETEKAAFAEKRALQLKLESE